MKTKQNDASVEAFLNGVADPKQREDCFTILKMMQEVTGAKPKMWGTSIVGFGSYHYKYPSGQEGDWFTLGFSPRKGNLTLYVLWGCAGQTALLKKLGKHKTGRSCLYVKRLADVDLATLRELMEKSFDHLSKTHLLRKSASRRPDRA